MNHWLVSVVKTSLRECLRNASWSRLKRKVYVRVEVGRGKFPELRIYQVEGPVELLLKLQILECLLLSYKVMLELYCRLPPLLLDLLLFALVSLLDLVYVALHLCLEAFYFFQGLCSDLLGLVVGLLKFLVKFLQFFLMPFLNNRYFCSKVTLHC